MNQNQKICRLEGHQEYNVTHLCTVKDCSLQSRWNCSECLIKQVHKHNNDKFLDCILSRNDIIYKLQKDIEKNNSKNQISKDQMMVLDQILSDISQLEQQIIDLKNLIQSINKQPYLSDDKEQQLAELIKEFQSDQFNQLNDQKIQIILNPLQLYDSNNIEQLIKQFRQLNNQIETIKNQFYKLSNQNDYSNNIQFHQSEYFVQEIEKTNKCFYASQISNNEQYLAYGGSDKVLKIYDLQQQKLRTDIQLNGSVTCVQFTEDSCFLFVGFGEGDIHQYYMLQDFKLIFQQKIHSGQIYNIIPLYDQYMLTSSADNTIIKTDLLTKQQIFRLSGHNGEVYTIQYMFDSKVLVSGSYDKSIKFWNCKDQSILIDKQSAQNSFIKQIQLINDQKNLLSLSHDGLLVKWKIDLVNKDIIKLSQFSDPNRIYNMYFNLNDKLIITCDKYVKILNIENQVIKQIDHQAGPNHQNYDCKQLENLNFISIRSLRLWQLDLEYNEVINNLFTIQIYIRYTNIYNLKISKIKAYFQSFQKVKLQNNNLQKKYQQMELEIEQQVNLKNKLEKITLIRQRNFLLNYMIIDCKIIFNTITQTFYSFIQYLWNKQ